MNYREGREFAQFVRFLTGPTPDAWIVSVREWVNTGDYVVRRDPVALAMRGETPRCDEALRFPGDAGLDEAKRAVVLKLAAEALPPRTGVGG